MRSCDLSGFKFPKGDVVAKLNASSAREFIEMYYSRDTLPAGVYVDSILRRGILDSEWLAIHVYGGPGDSVMRRRVYIKNGCIDIDEISLAVAQVAQHCEVQGDIEKIKISKSVAAEEKRKLVEGLVKEINPDAWVSKARRKDGEWVLSLRISGVSKNEIISLVKHLDKKRSNA